MNGMNLSGKPGMVHPMQMPPTLGQPPMPAIQPRLGTLQLTTGSPAPQLHDALRRAIFASEISLFVITGAVATFVHGLTEQPGGTYRSSRGIMGASPATW